MPLGQRAIQKAVGSTIRRWILGAGTDRPGTRDLLLGIQMLPLAFYLAWSDTLARYRRSVLGPFWLTLGTAIGVGGLGWLWSELLRVDRHTFVPSMTAGLIIWQLVSGVVVDSSSCFQGASSIIRNMLLPHSLHPLQLVLRHLINFFHNILVFVLVAIILDVPITWATLLSVPALVIVVLNLYWMSLLVGILGARFRDIEYAVAAMMPLLFFISPVLYRPEHVPAQAALVWLNPFSHLIEILRAPMLGTIPPPVAIVVSLAMFTLGGALTLYLFNARHSRIAFWV